MRTIDHFNAPLGSADLQTDAVGRLHCRRPFVASLERINACSQAQKIKCNKIMDVLEPILMSSVVSAYTEKEITMLYYALVFFVVALIAGFSDLGESQALLLRSHKFCSSSSWFCWSSRWLCGSCGGRKNRLRLCRSPAEEPGGACDFGKCRGTEFLIGIGRPL